MRTGNDPRSCICAIVDTIVEYFLQERSEAVKDRERNFMPAVKRQKIDDDPGLVQHIPQRTCGVKWQNLIISAVRLKHA